MSDRFVRALPGIAAASLATALAALAAVSTDLRRMTSESAETRLTVGSRMDAVGRSRPASLEDASWRKVIEDLRRASYVATVWVVGPDGRIALAKGSTAASTPIGANVRDLAGADARRLIEALDASMLSQEQRLLLLTAASVRREGEHNDIYRHLVRPVTGSDGSMIGVVAVAYAASSALAAPVSARYVSGLLVFVVAVVAYWLSLPLWVWLDGRAHGERAWTWAGFVLVGNVVALMAYLLTRAPRNPPASGAPRAL